MSDPFWGIFALFVLFCSVLWYWEASLQLCNAKDVLHHWAIKSMISPDPEVYGKNYYSGTRLCYNCKNNGFCFITHVSPKGHNKTMKVSNNSIISNNWCLESKTSHVTQSHALHTNDESLDDLSLRVSYCSSEKWKVGGITEVRNIRKKATCVIIKLKTVPLQKQKIIKCKSYYVWI